MTNKLLPLRGTKDLMPADYAVYEHIVDTAKNIGKLYGYEQISTPIIEYAKVFDRTLGNDSDIVSKEMYCFPDKSDELIALRPEFTAGIMRAFFSNNLTHKLPLKYFCAGPNFRYERPQAGRQRQFHQINFEFLGAEGASTDAETIKLGSDVLTALGVKDTILNVNSLGCKQSREIYQNQLFEYFSDYKNKLSEDSLKRLTANVLRILDSKDVNDQEIVKNAPKISESYTDEARNYFEEVLKYLDLLNLKYQINPCLVRGLDYYTHTAFEFVATKSNSSILGGGRYDGLAQIMGGQDVPAIGFGAGIERIILAGEFNIKAKLPVMILPYSEEFISDALLTMDKLRQYNIAVTCNSRGKLNKQIGKASSEGYQYLIIIGSDEIAAQKYRLKNLNLRSEEILSFDELINILKPLS